MYYNYSIICITWISHSPTPTVLSSVLPPAYSINTIGSESVVDYIVSFEDMNERLYWWDIKWLICKMWWPLYLKQYNLRWWLNVMPIVYKLCYWCLAYGVSVRQGSSSRSRFIFCLQDEHLVWFYIHFEVRVLRYYLN